MGLKALRKRANKNWVYNVEAIQFNGAQDMPDIIENMVDAYAITIKNFLDKDIENSEQCVVKTRLWTHKTSGYPVLEIDFLCKDCESHMLHYYNDEDAPIFCRSCEGK